MHQFPVFTAKQNRILMHEKQRIHTVPHEIKLDANAN